LRTNRDSSKKIGPDELRKQPPALSISEQGAFDMSKVQLPELDYLRQCVDYCPETGKFTWLVRPRWMFRKDLTWKQWNGRFAGKAAFEYAMRTGYLRAKLDQRIYYAHRLAYYLGTGESPNEIDHVNGRVCDNRLCNLRSVSHQENQKNRAKSPKTRTLAMGVSRTRSGRFMARIKHKKHELRLGVFDTAAEAKAARLAAEKALGFHVNHGRVPTRIETR